MKEYKPLWKRVKLSEYLATRNGRAFMKTLNKECTRLGGMKARNSAWQYVTLSTLISNLKSGRGLNPKTVTECVQVDKSIMDEDPKDVYEHVTDWLWSNNMDILGLMSCYKDDSINAVEAVFYFYRHDENGNLTV